MVRLRRSMHDLAEGRDVATIQFREGDFWQELAVDFNRVVGRVKSAQDNVEEGGSQPAQTTTRECVEV